MAGERRRRWRRRNGQARSYPNGGVRGRRRRSLLRLLKGEELGTVSRETQVPVHELERWRRLFLEGAANGFKRRDAPAAERELKRVQAKVGELTMKLEIVEWFLEKKGYGEELKKLKRSGEL